GRPYLDQWVHKIFRDAQTMMVQLESGGIDIPHFPALSDVVRLQQDPGYVTVSSVGNGSFHLTEGSMTRPPFDNKAVRQAYNYALDRKRWADTVLHGLGGPSQDLPWAPQSPAADPARNNLYSFDPDKAKSMLAAAGASNLEFDIAYGQGQS